MNCVWSPQKELKDCFGLEIDESGKRVDEKSVRCRLCNHKVCFYGNTINLNVNKTRAVLLLN